MQEQENSMKDSEDFQDVESNESGRLSHVSSQRAMIPSSRSMLSRDNCLPLDTWNQAGIQENIFCKSIFSVWITQKSSSKNSTWRRAKKPGSSPWSRKDEDESHKWRQKSRHTSNADICAKAVHCELYSAGGITAELPALLQDRGASAKRTQAKLRKG